MQVLKCISVLVLCLRLCLLFCVLAAEVVGLCRCLLLYWHLFLVVAVADDISASNQAQQV